MENGKLLDALPQHILVHYRVAAIDLRGQMACELHSGALGDARAFEIADGGPAKIMGNPAGRSRGLTCDFPDRTEILNRSAVAMEQPRDDATRSEFKFPGPLHLGFEDGSSGVSGKLRP
jgi:hypothetical protein